MKKIVELIVKLDEIELDGVGVDAIALVENPAIELDFLSFKEEKFVEPTAGETEDEFISRCIPVLIGEGYPEDQSAAICYGYWEGAIDTSGLTPYVDQVSDPKKQETYCQFGEDELNEEQKWILSQCETMGEEYDPHTAIFIDASAANFSTVTDFLKGIAALDVLGKKAKEDEGVQVFRYAGPSAERGFCRAMLRLNRVYRYEEIRELDTANPGFGPGQNDVGVTPSRNRYSVWEWKGGSNCRHYWESLMMFEQDGRKVFINQGPAANYNTPHSGANNAGMSNNDGSPSATSSVNNNASLKRSFAFNIDEDQRIVVGAAMIPNKMIKRKDDNGNPYWVYFTEETIRDIAEDYFEKYKQNNTNVEHNSDETHTRNTLLESWIVEDSQMDKSALYGFNLPKGSWMVSYKINDDETWKKIKNGELKGFSVEGYFLEKGEAMQAVEQTYREILDILDQIEE